MQSLDTRAHAWFRRAAPYINLHKGEVFVIVLQAEVLDLANSDNVFADIAVLNTLDIKIVIIVDIENKLIQALQQQNLLEIVEGKILLNNSKTMDTFLSIARDIQMQVFAKFSVGMPATTSYTPHIKLVSGNFISAMPFGIVNGIDFSFLGKVRKVEAENILKILDLDFGVVLSSWAYSITGEVFGLQLRDIVESVGHKLNANKVLFITTDSLAEDDHLTRGITPSDLNDYLLTNAAIIAKQAKKYLEIGVGVCDSGVSRVHILDANVDGVLLKELFSAKGIGFMITQNPYETLRKARLQDIPGLLKLLKPLEESGILIHRSKAWLEADIDKFSVLDLDSSIIACVALYAYQAEDMAELACLAVDKNYRNAQKAVLLLQRVEEQCKNLDIHKIFVLTTHTSHWFLANGFKAGELADLPEAKRLKYDKKRGSKIFIKSLVDDGAID